jgi:uncharacterized protein (DUF1778 family)
MVRLTPRLGSLLGVTAALFEVSLEAYILRILERQADEIEAETPTVTLSARDFQRFLEICEDDSPPSPALKRAAREFKKRYRDQIQKGEL